MRVIEVYDSTGGDLARAAAAKPPFGPGFDAALVARAARMEVWATQFSDPGEHVEFRLLDAGGALIASARVEGF